ncbi:MAG: MBL fold metallo-hydrolase [Caulobacterales bacterium]|uniref:MBL fold metallo-hydrolase n=1 Tax=Glycocaulis sp. TaxID=1969725 RepID=UPI003F9F6E03
MSGLLRLTLLGCGSSGGVPRIDGDWGDCDPAEPRNYRTRCSLLVERAESLSAFADGIAITRLIIDTSPDFRFQMLRECVRDLDGVAFTHDHADQSHGIDDLRAIVYRRRARLLTFMADFTFEALNHRFGYIFETPEGSGYPPILEPVVLPPDGRFSVDGAGGRLEGRFFSVDHGQTPCSGLRFGPVAYTPDVKAMPDAAFDAISGISLWIADALRDKPHPSHSHLEQTLAWAERCGVAQTVLTNMHIDLDYRSLLARCREGVRPGYDGLKVIVDERTGDLVAMDEP